MSAISDVGSNQCNESPLVGPQVRAKIIFMLKDILYMYEYLLAQGTETDVDVSP